MDFSVQIFQLALTYFLMINAIGNIPAILALVKDETLERQKQIMFREGIFVFVIALSFEFFGEFFLGLLNIGAPALSLTGGVLVFLVAIQMIFPSHKSETTVDAKQEPFIVPIATPLLVGPGTLTIIMLTAAGEPNSWIITIAVTLACSGVLAVLMVAPYLQKLIGKTGLQVLEQIMGMLLTLMSIEMILKGLAGYIKAF